MTIVFESSYCNVYGTGYQLRYVYRNNGSGIAVEYITGTSNLLSNLGSSQRTTNNLAGGGDLGTGEEEEVSHAGAGVTQNRDGTITLIGRSRDGSRRGEQIGRMVISGQSVSCCNHDRRPISRNLSLLGLGRTWYYIGL
jgi:hypothetical protein